MHKEAEESERLLKDRLQHVESQRLDLENELSRQKLNAANERMLVDEQLTSAKQRIRADEVRVSYDVVSVTTDFLGFYIRSVGISDRSVLIGLNDLPNAS